MGLVWDVRLPTEAQKQKLLKKKTNGSKPGSTAPTQTGKAETAEARRTASDAAMAN